MKNIKEILLLLLMGISIIVGSIFASHTPPLWFKFSLSMVVLMVAILFQKKILRKKLESPSNKKYSVDNFVLLLESIKKSSLKIVENKNEFTKDSLIEFYENKVNNKLIEFEDYYLSLSNIMGVSKFTSVMSIYAIAERNLNRAYSAAIDGYITESLNSTKYAIEIIDETISKVNNG